VTLQANEGTKDAPKWVNVHPLTRQFTVAKKVPVSKVNVVPEANEAGYTISLATTVRPTLQAKFWEKRETASYTTGKWSSSDPLIATINENTGLVATTGAKVGSVTFTFTADNGTEDTADDVKGESKPYTVTAGDSLALVIPGRRVHRDAEKSARHRAVELQRRADGTGQRVQLQDRTV